MERLSAMTAITGSDWAAGIAARGRALVSDSGTAEHWYGESIVRLARTPLRPELARSRLLYGEWLRRANRRIDAREQLRAAHEAFVEMGAEAFAERARRELVATGEKVRKRDEATRQRSHPPGRAHRPARPRTDVPMPRSVPSSSSACEPSNGTYAKCSRNSASPRVASSKTSSRFPIRSAPRSPRPPPGSRPGFAFPEFRRRRKRVFEIRTRHVALLDVSQPSLCARSIQAYLSIMARMPVKRCRVTKSVSKASIAV